MTAMHSELTGRRVLVVVDNFFIAADLQHFLEGEGCTVAGPTASVEGAMSCLLEGAPDAAILDICLDAESSAPVAAELQAAGVPYLFLSGYGRDVLPPEHSGQMLLGKPWSEGELRARLHDLLEKVGRPIALPAE